MSKVKKEKKKKDVSFSLLQFILHFWGEEKAKDHLKSVESNNTSKKNISHTEVPLIL